MLKAIVQKVSSQLPFLYPGLTNLINLPGKLNKKIAAGVLVLIVIVFFAGYKFLFSQKKQLETVSVQRKDISVSFSASGKVKAEKTVKLHFLSSGKLAWIGISEGDLVKKWQALARLDTTKASSNYRRALSDLRAAEATLERVYDELKGNDTETFTQKEKRTIAEVAKDKAYEAVIQAKKTLADATLLPRLHHQAAW